MKTLSQLYKNNELGLKAKKIFSAPISSIYIEEGFNIREENKEHVESLVHAYKSGNKLPAIIVEVTEKGLKIIDGHHRYLAAKEAGIEFLETTDYIGDEGGKLALMITSSQGLALNPVERAEAYARMRDEGYSASDIAELVGKTPQNIYQHLILADANDRVKDLLKGKMITLQQALTLAKDYREDSTVLDDEELLDDAVTETKQKIEKQTFSVKNAKTLIKIITGVGVITDEDEVVIRIPPELKDQVLDLIQQFEEQ